MSASSSPVRFAILGFGLHGERRLIPAFAASQHTSLAGIWRRDPAAALQACREHNIRVNFPTRELLCSSPDIDAVLVATPDALHCDDVLLALEHGKSVLCEKPVAMNAAEARRMADAAAAAGVLFGVAQNFRYTPSIHLFRDWIVQGRIGAPQLAYAQFIYPGHKSARPWIANPALACGGPIADVGVHCIDALRFLLGEDVLSATTFAAQDELSGELEAGATIQLEFSGGILANVSVSARAPYRTLLEVVGSEGVITSENGLSPDREVEVQLRSAGDLVESVTVSNTNVYAHMLDCFAASLRTGTPFSSSGHDAIQNMLALDAAYKSWHTGNREPIA